MRACLSRTTMSVSQTSVLARTLFAARTESQIVSLTRLPSGGRNSCQTIARLTLQRESRRNALSRGMVDGLRAAFANIVADPPAALIVASSRPDVFCAGADLKERAALSPRDARALSRDLRQSFSDLAALPCPTIAVIEGFALGGGAELALACDIRVASDRAIFGFPETTLAIIPGAGGTQRLPRLVGISRAKELIFTGRRVDGREAAHMNLVDFLVSSEKEGAAIEKAMDLASAMTACGPLALQLAKTAINNGMEVDIERGLAIEAACYYQTIPTRDRNEGVAAFNERRKPEYVGE
jgi:methylglutaconyl-CoA hydratase